MQLIQEKTKLSKNEIKRFNPVDAFPGDAVIFARVLDLLRGLSSILDVHIVYLDILRPFAESTLYERSIGSGSAMGTQWIYDAPVRSDVEAKLRQLLLEIGCEKVLGIQVLNLGWQLTVDIDELSKLFMINGRPDLPSTFQPANISEIAVGLPIIFNTLAVRCTIIPAENGHCSQYYAALAAGGIVPEPHSSSQPPLGSHLHIPKFPPLKPHKKCRRSKQAKTQSADKVSSNKNPNDKNTKVGSRSSKTDTAIENGQHSTTGVGSNSCNVKYSDNVGRIFKNPRIHGAFLGVGDYGNLALPNGKFGLGFRRFSLADYSFTALGHSGIGGSMGFCDIRHDFAIAVTVNNMSLGGCDKKYNSIGLFRAECAIAR